MYEGSSVKENPEDKKPSGPYIMGSAKISRGVTLALYTGRLNLGVCLFSTDLEGGDLAWQTKNKRLVIFLY